MNSQKLKISLILSVLVLMLTLNSCVKETPLQPTPDSFQETNFGEIATASPEIASDITVENGILAFKSADDFQNTLLALNRMSPQEQLQWEKSVGFASMQQIFNAVVAAEFEAKGAHSALYDSNLQTGLIVPNQISGLYNLNLFNPAYASVLNKNGVVVVENDVYQFGGEALKIWKNGDINKLESLQNASSNNSEIQIIPMNFQEVVLRDATQWRDRCLSSDDSGMLLMSASYNSNFLDPAYTDVVFIDYFITVVSAVIDAGGVMKFDPNAVVRLSGKSEINFPVINGDMVRIRSLIRSYDQISGVGGSFIFVTSESGNYNIRAPWTFVEPAYLMRALWNVQNKLGNGSSFSCELTY